jgi:hypothetical protein
MIMIGLMIMVAVGDAVGVSAMVVQPACVVQLLGRADAVQLGKEAAALHPAQAQADSDDQAITRDLDSTGRLGHGCCGPAEQRRKNSDDRHGGKRL